MKKRIAPVLEIEVDITQPTRCTSDCQFITPSLCKSGPGYKCSIFKKSLRMVAAKNWGDFYYTHRCKQCRDAEVK